MTYRLRTIVLAAAACLAIYAARTPAIASPVTADVRHRVLTGDCGNLLSPMMAASRAGDLQATKMLAVMYDRGCGVAVDERREVVYLRQILARRPDDRFARGMMAIYGADRASDFQSAIRHLAPIANAGDAFANLGLARAYAVTHDFSMTYRIDHDAAASGDACAQARYGYDVLLGRGTALDGPLALRILEPLARRNNLLALEYLGEAYNFGAPGIPRDRARALSYYRRAVAAGDAGATQPYVATLIASGDTATVRSEGERVLRSAVARLYIDRDVPAVELAVLLTHKEYGHVDYTEAATLFRQGIRARNVDAMEGLAYLDFKGYGTAENIPECIQLLREAAAAGSPTAKENLASFHVDETVGAEIPTSRAYDYYNDYVIWHQPVSDPNPAVGSPAYQTIHPPGT